jgi:hypothetical protein
VPTVSDAPRRVRISTGTVVAMGFAAALAAALTVVLLELGAQRPTATVPEPAQVLPGAPESNAQSEAGETGDASGSDQPGSPDEPGEGGRGARARRTYFNARAGYGFNYPRSWSLRSRGETSKVSSPDRTEVVSFALGPVSLPVTYDSFSELLRASYARVSLTRQHPVTLSGHAAIEVTGRAVNGSGVPLRFRALLVERPGSRSVGAFVATRGRRPPSRDALRILSSLHLAAQT